MEKWTQKSKDLDGKNNVEADGSKGDLRLPPSPHGETFGRNRQLRDPIESASLFNDILSLKSQKMSL